MATIDTSRFWRNEVRRAVKSPVGATFLLAVGAATPLLFIPFVILAGRVTPGYGHMASTFSDASSQGSPRPEFMTAGLMLVSFGLLLCGFGLAQCLPRGSRLVQTGLTVTSAAILLTALFRDYNRASGVPRNREGLLHNTFATIGVFAILGTILAIILVVRSQRDWAHLATPGVVVLIIVAVSGLAFTWGPDSHDGLAERILAGTALVYLSWVALTALTLTRGTSLLDPWLQRYPDVRPASISVLADD